MCSGKRMACAVSMGLLFILTLMYYYQACARPLENNEHFADLVAATKKSVVAVGTYYFNDIPKIQYLGTGFVTGNGRYVVTNFHVVAGLIRNKKLHYLRIFHKDFPEKGIEAGIVKKDRFHDIAVLKHNGPLLPALKTGDSSKVREGYEVFFTGYPLGFVLGLNPTTHKGIISCISPIARPSPSARIINADIISHLEKPYKIFQVDATAYPGNSGSPLCLADTGEVIGVINKVFVKGRKEYALTNPSGITYAIPSVFFMNLEKKIGRD
jgi:S1-C subfamily serine protease